MTIRIILEKKEDSIPAKQNKTAVLIIGRFQPPTLGHSKLIDAAKKAFRKYKYDAIILCVVAGKETGKNKKVNPLSGKSRIFYLENSKYSKGIKLRIVHSAFDAFIKCREMGYEPMCVVGGKFISGEKEENRAHNYKKLLDKYFTEPNGDPIHHRAIVLERDPESMNSDGISGSTVRAAVLADRYDDFKEMVALTDEDLIKQMYNELRKNLKAK